MNNYQYERNSRFNNITYLESFSVNYMYYETGTHRMRLISYPAALALTILATTVNSIVWTQIKWTLAILAHTISCPVIQITTVILSIMYMSVTKK
jgi:hypothetical protein